MAKPKTAQKVSFSIPYELLRWSDALAEKMGVDRYDVVRMALSKGLLVMQMERELQSNPDLYLEGVRRFAHGEPGAAEQLAGQFGEKLPGSVRQDVADMEAGHAEEKKRRTRRRPAA